MRAFSLAFLWLSLLWGHTAEQHDDNVTGFARVARFDSVPLFEPPPRHHRLQRHYPALWGREPWAWKRSAWIHGEP